MRTHLDLFSGIGGFALAARWNGVETIGFSEVDPHCNAVLRKHWPGVANYGDVRDVPAIDDVWLLTGGFPCQPFSQAGKRAGAGDDRYLWPAMLDVIERVRPTWILGENVPGIIGLELDRVLSDLERTGYGTWACVVPACAVGAPHERERLWIVAYSDARMGKAWPRHFVQHRQPPNVQGFNGCNTPTSENVWVAMAAEIRRVDDGIPGKVDRTAALGNAIVPQVAARFIGWMIEAEG